MERAKVRRDREGTTVTITYKERDDGWYVRTPEMDEFVRFAAPEARSRDVRQLINKKWNFDYGDPDPLDDTS